MFLNRSVQWNHRVTSVIFSAGQGNITHHTDSDDHQGPKREDNLTTPYRGRLGSARNQKLNQVGPGCHGISLTSSMAETLGPDAPFPAARIPSRVHLAGKADA